MPVQDRLQHAWNAFLNKDPTNNNYYSGSNSTKPDRVRLTRGNERSIITAVYNRIAIDVASINVSHVQLDKNDRYIENVESRLQRCFSLEANIDQSGRELIQDAAISLMDEGSIAIIPTTTDGDPTLSDAYDIYSLRVGKITKWYPKAVTVMVYNEDTGLKQEITLPKRNVAIVENPLYAIMNDNNSTLQRLIRKLNILDVIDEQSGSGKLDMIIQLPYVIKTTAKKELAEKRRGELENQLTDSKYGIAYIDGTEKITQLNRSVDNNLMTQIKFLTEMLYSQLGITQSVMDGTADEKTMINYFNRTVEPILSAIVDAMKRKFLTKTAISQKKTIAFFRDPFKLVPVSELSEIADKFTRNEIMSSNEIRQVIGMKPSSDPKADELRNKNLSEAKQDLSVPQPTNEAPMPEEPMNEHEYLSNVSSLDSFDSELDEIESMLSDDSIKHYSSEYYNPTKAHEYYEKTKQLKGRKSTSGLNDEGKAAAKNVKENLTIEKKSKVEIEKKSFKDEIESYKDQMQSKIDSIRSILKNMSKENKAKYRESIQSEIDKLREDNSLIRESLKEDFTKTKGDIKDTYDQKYLDELDKIRNTKSMLK